MNKILTLSLVLAALVALPALAQTDPCALVRCSAQFPICVVENGQAMCVAEPQSEVPEPSIIPLLIAAAGAFALARAMRRKA